MKIKQSKQTIFKQFSIVSTLTIIGLILAACSKQPDLTLHVLECGNIETRDVSIFSPGVDEGQKKDLVDNCYLIQHEKGSLMWDTGLADAIGEAGVEVFNGAFYMNVTNPLADQLKAINVDPGKITHMALSHFHGDHSGNANMFTNASLIIQKPEYEAAFGENPAQFGFEPNTYDKVNREKIKVIDGDYDVFGDGKVIIKSAPGHTPGHQMLFLDLPNSGPIMLSGDLYHFTKNRTHKRVPSFNFNKEQTLATMDEIEKFVAEKGAQFWIQHDKEQNENILYSPKFYN